MARTSEYKSELGEFVCELIARGASLVTACSKLNLSYGTVNGWLAKNESFANSYALARERSADYLAEEIVDLSDDETIPADSRRIRVESRKWIAAKLKPKKYGDKTILSNDPDNPIGSLALRLDTAISHKSAPIDITPAKIIDNAPLIDDGSDLI